MPTPSPTPSPTTTTYPTTMPTPSPTPSPVTPAPITTTIPTPSPSPSPTDMPTIMPTPSPTMTPTEWCPCIIVNSTAASGAFDGTFIITGHWFNRHWHWVQNDYTGVPSKEIYWELQGVFNGYWVLVGSGGVFATYPATDKDKDTPPFGPSLWMVYNPGTVTGGSQQTFDMHCDTCVPTPSPSPAPTKMPTTMPTPSPTPSPTTTTYPTTMPTPSPSPSPTTTTYPT